MGIRQAFMEHFNMTSIKQQQQKNKNRFFPRAYDLPSHCFLAHLIVPGMNYVLWNRTKT